MTIDWTINIGAVLGGLLSGMLAVVGAYGAALRFWHKVDKRISSTEQQLTHHAEQLTAHNEKAARHEQMLVEVLQDVARIIGRLGSSSNWTGADRRRPRTEPQGG